MILIIASPSMTLPSAFLFSFYFFFLSFVASLPSSFLPSLAEIHAINPTWTHVEKRWRSLGAAWLVDWRARSFRSALDSGVWCLASRDVLRVWGRRNICPNHFLTTTAIIGELPVLADFLHSFLL